MAGNKADLSNIRVVEFDEAKQYAEENGLLFMETSAKTGMNVNDIFLAIGTLLTCPSNFVEQLLITFVIAAKKLPKNDGANNQGTSIRPNGNETNRPTNNCCK